MAASNVSRETLITAVNLVTTMAVSDLTRERNEPPTKTLLDFMASDTADLLYDLETKFWWGGPSAAENAFRAETGG